MGSLTSICCEEREEKKKEKIKILPQPPSAGVSQKNLMTKHEPIINNLTQAKSLKKKSQIAEEDALNQVVALYPHPSALKIKLDDFKIDYKLGDGGFGEVYLGELKKNMEKGITHKYAIKKMTKQSIAQGKLKDSVKLQKKILQVSISPFITSLYYAFRDEKNVYFVMEWAPGGDTYSLIREGSKRTPQYKAKGEEALRFILGCVILGLEYLHSNDIMYRDLKPENILIFQNGYAKITDFGLAKQVKYEQISKTQAGTSIYFAPEMVLREGYTKQIDFWTIGVYAYQMSVFSPPFPSVEIQDRMRVKRLVKNAENHRDWKKSNLSPELKDFINGFLRFDPKQRLGHNGWDQIKNHSFFRDFDWKSLSELKIKSPIKQIIEKYKTKMTPYNPNEAKKVINRVPDSDSPEQVDLQGWTYVRQQDKN